ncbi:hypothetical protein KGF54_002425 [Candida jiufengensis]|uniref:uncharacterized protein n=1 Tax=Candida jiufengensis TaxID=497108 RepID=UPI002225A83B|nr:uncharacterized protein KGF54_002425 [Candida jiufengensis]KAI5954649.1 hypothetical protein KGF54_002425 [Candida jiufengensis]
MKFQNTLIAGVATLIATTEAAPLWFTYWVTAQTTSTKIATVYSGYTTGFSYSTVYGRPPPAATTTSSSRTTTTSSSSSRATTTSSSSSRATTTPTSTTPSSTSTLVTPTTTSISTSSTPTTTSTTSTSSSSSTTSISSTTSTTSTSSTTSSTSSTTIPSSTSITSTATPTSTTSTLAPVSTSLPPSSTLSTLTTTSSINSVNVPTSDVAFANEILGEHNRLRALHGVPALIWNNTLATYAANYAATHFDCNNVQLIHSGGPYGENLAAGYVGGIDPTDAWYNEIKDYNFNQPGYSSATGHFTQVVWRSTSRLGCARVIEYSETRGNIVGTDPATGKSFFEENVLPPLA